MNPSSQLLLVILFPAAFQGQAQAPTTPPATQAPTAQPPAPAAVLDEPVFVRRFSAGINLTVLGLKPIRELDSSQVFTSPALEVRSTTVPKSHLASGGIVLQLAVTERIAVAANVFYRRVEYEDTTVLLTGVDNPNTVIDDRPGTNLTDKTRAHYWDVPVMVRYYNLGRYEEGNRWFFELGATRRHVRGIRSTLGTQPPGGELTTVGGAVTPRKRDLLGGTAGFGVQLIDPVGVRVIPEVRYTKWMGRTFDNRATRSNTHQIEFILSLSF
ncbi:MAG: hypothetical protein ACRD44_16590 [Bryobacteraceae bacterium]